MSEHKNATKIFAPHCSPAGDAPAEADFSQKEIDSRFFLFRMRVAGTLSHMNRSRFSIAGFRALGLGALSCLALTPSLLAQVPIVQGSPVLVTNFDGNFPGVSQGPYNGSLPVPNPAAGSGQLDSAAFSIGPYSPGGTATFGQFPTAPAAGVYGLNTNTFPGFNTSQILGFVAPVSASAGATIASFSLTGINNATTNLNQFTLGFSFDHYNASGTALTLSVSYTIGGTTTTIPGLALITSNGLGDSTSTLQSSTFTTVAPVVPNGNIVFNFTVMTNAAFDLSAGNTRNEVGFDNIFLGAAVPEPGTYMAGALSLACAGVMLRRRTR